MYCNHIQPNVVDAKFYIHARPQKKRSALFHKGYFQLKKQSLSLFLFAKHYSSSVSFSLNLADAQIKQLNILKTHERG